LDHRSSWIYGLTFGSIPASDLTLWSVEAAGGGRGE